MNFLNYGWFKAKGEMGEVIQEIELSTPAELWRKKGEKKGKEKLRWKDGREISLRLNSSWRLSI